MFPNIIKFERTIPARIHNWSTQHPKHARIIPRIIIYMFLATILSGFIYTPLDLIIFIVSLIILYFVLYFLPLEEMIVYIFPSDETYISIKKNKQEKE